MATIETLPHIADLAARGTLFVVNHSGGKDSQAMFHVVRRLVPWDSQANAVRRNPGDRS